MWPTAAAPPTLPLLSRVTPEGTLWLYGLAYILFASRVGVGNAAGT